MRYVLAASFTAANVDDHFEARVVLYSVYFSLAAVEASEEQNQGRQIEMSPGLEWFGIPRKKNYLDEPLLRIIGTMGIARTSSWVRSPAER